MLRGHVRALVTTCWIAGSIGFARDARAADPEIRLGLAADGSTVDLDEGHVLVLELPANFSTGHQWQIVEGDPSIIASFPQATFVHDSKRAGAGGLLTIRFGAVAAGATRLTLAYRRSSAVAPARTMTVNVRTYGTFTGAQRTAIDAARAQLLAAGILPPSTGSVFDWVTDPFVRAWDDGVALFKDFFSVEESRLVKLADQGLWASEFPVIPLPSHFNWCERGMCTPVKEQNTCGSCWAFASVGVLESQILMRDGFAKNLSEQYLVSCNDDGWDCGGGHEAHAYHHWKATAGEPGPGAVYEQETGYPDYSRPPFGRTACTPPHTHRERIWNYATGLRLPPDLIKRAIAANGPVTATVCAGPAFWNYHGGVFSTNERCDNPINHMIVLVGWDDAEGVWYLRNSYGEDWGESATPWRSVGGGYMRIKYGTSNVGFTASFVKYAGSPTKLWNVLPVVETLLGE